jgi:hypothetical protein
VNSVQHLDVEDAVDERFGAVYPLHKACMAVVYAPARTHLVLPHPEDPCEPCLPARRTQCGQPAMPFPCSDHVLQTHAGYDVLWSCLVDQQKKPV